MADMADKGSAADLITITKGDMAVDPDLEASREVLALLVQVS